MKLDKLTRAIGSIIVAIILMSVPILCVCSLVFNWYVFFKVILGWGVLMEAVALSIVIYLKGESEVK